MNKNCKLLFFILILIIFPLPKFAQTELINLNNDKKKIYKKKEFKTLNINQTLLIALTNNPTIEIFTMRIKQAKEKINQNNSCFWPNINFEGYYYIENSLEIDKKENLNTYAMEINIAWLLFDTFKRRFISANSEYGKEIAIEMLKNIKKNLLISVSELFYRAKLFRENVKNAIGNENFHKRLLNEVKEKYKLGISSLSDVLNFEIKLNKAKITRSTEEKNYKITMLSLSSILGISDPKFPYHIRLKSLFPITEQELKIPKYKNILKLVINQNPNIKLSKLNLKKIQSQIEAINSNKYPKIYFHGSVKAKDIKKVDLAKNNLYTCLSLKISYNIFSKGLNNLKKRELKNCEIEYIEIMKKTFISERTRIGTCFLKICYTQFEFLSQRENVNLIKQTRDLLEKEYKYSHISLSRLNEVQNEFINSRNKLYSTLLNLRHSLIEFKILTGEFKYIN